MRTLEAAARRLKRHPGIPALWLFTDPVRLPDPLAVAARLPPGSAVVARNLAPEMLAALAALARRRRLHLLVAGDGRAALALRLGSPRLGSPSLGSPPLGSRGAGLHLPDRRPSAGLLAFLRGRHGRLLSVAAHGRAGLARARRLGASVVVLSPVFPTASHPGAPALGPLRWAALARGAGRPVVALGGIGVGNAGRLPPCAVGIAAIAGFRGGAG